MSSRTDMDKPATILAAVIGLVLIGVSLPFLILDGNEGGQRYSIAWAGVPAENGQAQRALSGTGTVEVPIRFDSIIPSNATIAITCNDTFTAPVQNAATVTWQLERNGTVVDQGTGCPSNERVALGTHPDVGAATADSADEAVEAAEGDAAVAAEFVLVVTVARQASPGGGLPVGQPTFTGQATLTIEEWSATANEPGQEATR